MRRALLAALVVGIAAPSIGVFLVQRRLALMGDGIGHVAFMGVAAGLFLGTSPVITGIVAASLAGAGIEVLREKGRAASDVALALIFYGGIAGGALLAFKSGQSNKVLGYLFGSVLTVNNEDLMILSVSGVWCWSPFCSGGSEESWASGEYLLPSGWTPRRERRSCCWRSGSSSWQRCWPSSWDGEDPLPPDL